MEIILPRCVFFLAVTLRLRCEISSITKRKIEVGKNVIYYEEKETVYAIACTISCIMGGKVRVDANSTRRVVLRVNFVNSVVCKLYVLKRIINAFIHKILYESR